MTPDPTLSGPASHTGTAESARHYHVPLVLGPYGHATDRGS
jgi:5-hydroxyisourate hydrolase-like protein (transthyretin family)